MQRLTTTLLLLALGLALTPDTAEARIKLAAQPDRQRVEIQLDHGRYTLVEEERIVPLLASNAARGNNQIDFSWANTQIDKRSIQFRPLAIRENGRFRPVREIDGQSEIAVINVAYPPNENALVWEVYASRACALKVRVSYLIANLDRTFAYRALANRDETHLTLKKYLQLRNYSGEDFGDAGIWAGFGPSFLKPVGQQVDIKLLLQQFARVPIRKTYTFDWFKHGKLNADKPHASRVLMHYELTNDEKHGLGAFPLQPGKARIFISDGRGGEAFLGEDWARFTPLDDRMRLYLGEARDIVCTRIVQDNKRHHTQGDLFDQELWLRYEIENYKDKPITLDIVEQINALAAQYGARVPGDAEWVLGKDTTAGLALTTHSGSVLPELHVKAPARPKDPNAKVEKVTVTLHVRIKNLWPR
jgi:hypothetical protein